MNAAGGARRAGGGADCGMVTHGARGTCNGIGPIGGIECGKGTIAKCKWKWNGCGRIRRGARPTQRMVLWWTSHKNVQKWFLNRIRTDFGIFCGTILWPILKRERGRMRETMAHILFARFAVAIANIKVNRRWMLVNFLWTFGGIVLLTNVVIEYLGFNRKLLSCYWIACWNNREAEWTSQRGDWRAKHFYEMHLI